MISQNKTFRLFVSSTFNDFKEEREILHKEVFPEIQKYCESKGYQFQPIDLRWGINEEAQLDQKTIEICLEEVNACKSHPQPNFLIMLGKRYGWVPLPYKIEASEFTLLLEQIMLYSPLSLPYLNYWYKIDYNEIPSSYTLSERKNELLNTEVNIEFRKDFISINNEKNDGNVFWEQHEEIIRNVLQDASKKVLNKFDQIKYYLSATEQEALHGIFELDYDANQRYIISYIRDDDTDIDYRLINLKSKIIATLDEDNILQSNNINNFQKFTYERLIKFIDMRINEFESIDLILQEKHLHQQHKDNLLKDFLGRDNILKQINDYVNATTVSPLFIEGISGIGKSSLMAQAIQMNIEKNIVYRFIGASTTSTNLKKLLNSIIQEIIPQNDNLIAESQDENFYLYIHDAILGIEKPIIIFLDAIDQLTEKISLLWLPKFLPHNVKIVISVLNDEKYPDDNYYFNIFKNSYLNSTFIDVPQLPYQTAKEILLLNLAIKNRRLNEHQLNYVLKQFEKVKTPLYLKFALELIKNWHYNNTKELYLADNINDLIKDYLNNLILSSYHSEILVERVFGYIYASRYGLSENELIDILSNDREVMNEFNNTYFQNYLERIPMSAWVRLHYQIKPFLLFQGDENNKLFNFFHREFSSVIYDTYYKNKNDILHGNLANYFKSKNDNLSYRVLAELPYHLHENNQSLELIELLKNRPFFIRLLEYNDLDLYYYTNSTNQFDAINSIIANDIICHSPLESIMDSILFAEYLSTVNITTGWIIRLYNKSLELCPEKNYKNIMKYQIYENIGQYYLSNQDYENAIIYFKDGYKHCNQYYGPKDPISMKFYQELCLLEKHIEQAELINIPTHYNCISCGSDWYEENIYTSICPFCNSDDILINTSQNDSLDHISEDVPEKKKKNKKKKKNSPYV